MREYLYRVGIKDKKSGEKLSLRVWAKNTDEATHKLCDVLIGYYAEYEWTGSGPIYENNKLIEREAKD